MDNTHNNQGPPLVRGHSSAEHGTVPSPRVCLLVWFGLLLLTATAVGAAAVDFGIFHVLVAMAAATLKAGLVAFWYMQIKYEGVLVKGMVFTACFILALCISFTFFDVAYR